jgi:nicotinate-nucleotide pyrophosphorylase
MQDIVFHVSGSSAIDFKGRKVGLNSLQRMSAIAKPAVYVKLLEGTNTKY